MEDRCFSAERTEIHQSIAREIIGHALKRWAEYPPQSPERAAIDELVTMLETWAKLDHLTTSHE